MSSKDIPPDIIKCVCKSLGGAELPKITLFCFIGKLIQSVFPDLNEETVGNYATFLSASVIYCLHKLETEEPKS